MRNSTDSREPVSFTSVLPVVRSYLQLRNVLLILLFASMVLIPSYAWVQPRMPAPRFVYFKLPIEQTEYHWIFQDRAAYLSGTLTLNIERGDRSEIVTVFDNGNISEDWEEITNESNPDEIYFGFVSRRKYSVALKDRVEMVLSITNDIEGKGPHTRGILRAGEYRSVNYVTVFWIDNDMAFLVEKDWNPQWDIKVTHDTGWMEDRTAHLESTEAK